MFGWKGGRLKVQRWGEGGAKIGGRDLGPVHLGQSLFLLRPVLLRPGPLGVYAKPKKTKMGTNTAYARLSIFMWNVLGLGLGFGDLGV